MQLSNAIKPHTTQFSSSKINHLAIQTFMVTNFTKLSLNFFAIESCPDCRFVNAECFGLQRPDLYPGPWYTPYTLVLASEPLVWGTSNSVIPAISWGNLNPPRPESQIPQKNTQKQTKNIKNASNSPPPPDM